MLHHVGVSLVSLDGFHDLPSSSFLTCSNVQEPSVSVTVDRHRL